MPAPPRCLPELEILFVCHRLTVFLSCFLRQVSNMEEAKVAPHRPTEAVAVPLVEVESRIGLILKQPPDFLVGITRMLADVVERVHHHIVGAIIRHAAHHLHEAGALRHLSLHLGHGHTSGVVGTGNKTKFHLQKSNNPLPIFLNSSSLSRYHVRCPGSS